MKESDFLNFYNSFTVQTRDIVIKASKEYSSENDKFENFSGLAAKLGMSKEKILLVYMQKHIDGIYKYVNNPIQTQRDTLQGRIIDAVNYLIILAAMDFERVENNKKALQASTSGGFGVQSNIGGSSNILSDDNPNVVRNPHDGFSKF